MSIQSVTYTAPHVPPTVTLDIPVGYELVEPEPRQAKVGELFLGWKFGDFDNDPTILEYKSDHNNWHLTHPILGKKRFIIQKIKPVFIPKFGDLVEVSDTPKCTNKVTPGWQTRIYVTSKGNKHYCLMRSMNDLGNSQSSLNAVLNGDMLELCDWECIRPVDNSPQSCG